MKHFEEYYENSQSLLSECIIISGNFKDEKEQDDIILAKNRDRKYKPTIRIVKELINGREVCYFEDMTTGWKEGLNSLGIGILNSALAVADDESQGAVTSFGMFKKTVDGDKILRALGKPNLDEAVSSIKTYNRGLAGHTVLSDGSRTIYVEFPDIDSGESKTKEFDPKSDIIVRTNHGAEFKKAGYTFGDSLESSTIRLKTAENELKKVVHQQYILKAMRRKFYRYDSGLNMKRDTPDMKTTSQIMLNVTKLELTLNIFTDNIEEFLGVVNKLPKGHKSRIKVMVQFDGQEQKIKEINENKGE